MKKVWKYSEEEIVINLAAALLGVEVLPWPLQECMGSAATLFYAPPLPLLCQLFQGCGRQLPGVGWRMQESEACMCTQCTMHRRATKKVQRTSSVYARASCPCPWASMATPLLSSRTRYDINRRRIEVRKPIKTHNPIFSSFSLSTSWCFSGDQKSQFFFVGALNKPCLDLRWDSWNLWIIGKKQEAVMTNIIQ